jgi:Mrp family chromosome partitioning ATPase
LVTDPSFVGRRQEPAQLTETLHGKDSVRVTAAVEGLAGVGKSELALQLADRLAAAGHFPGGLFWLDAEGPELTGTWGGTIADQPIGSRYRVNVERTVGSPSVTESPETT